MRPRGVPPGTPADARGARGDRAGHGRSAPVLFVPVPAVLLGIGGLFLLAPGRAARWFGTRRDGRETFALHRAVGVRTATLGLTMLVLARGRHWGPLGVVSSLASLDAVGDAVIAWRDSGGDVRAGARHLPGVVLTAAWGLHLVRRAGREQGR